MRYVHFGKSELDVSRIGLDCQALGVAQRERGWDPFSYDGRVFATRTVHAALEAGINVFDTSPDAGLGRAESLLGKALRGRRQGILIASKLPRADGDLDVENSIHGSMRRLRTDCIDILYIGDKVLESSASAERRLDTIERLRDQGAIGHIGLLVTDPARALPLIESGRFHIAQLQCDITRQGPASEALDACYDRGMGVSIMKSLASKSLESIVSALDPEWNGRSKVRRSCLRFLLSDCRVHMINVGMRWEHEVVENTRLFTGLETVFPDVASHACAL